MMSLAFSRSLSYCEPIAERLGWVVVHSLWQFTLVALVACVLSLAMKRGAASTRYAALLVTMLMIVALPFVTWFALPSQDSPSTAAFESDNAGATRNQTTVEIPLPSSLDRDTSHPSAELGWP
jgi:hypothetical protein